MNLFFSEIAKEFNVYGQTPLVNKLESIGLKLEQPNSKIKNKNTHLSPLKVLMSTTSMKLPTITPEYLYMRARLTTHDNNQRLYNSAGVEVLSKLKDYEDYIIQLSSDDGVTMYPKLIGLYDGTISDLYLDKNARSRFSFGHGGV